MKRKRTWHRRPWFPTIWHQFIGTLPARVVRAYWETHDALAARWDRQPQMVALRSMRDIAIPSDTEEAQ